MASLVDEILKSEAERQSQLKGTDVEKNLPVEIDAGNLLAVDGNIVDVKLLRQNPSEYICSLSRDNTQLLFNALWKLPVEVIDDTMTAKLPRPTTVLPREKPLPGPKQPTKWEKFAKRKGIKKKKKSTLVWDEQSKDWKPRWGYKRAGSETSVSMYERKPGEDPNVHKFATPKAAKKERVAQNEFNRLRNVQRSMKKKTAPGIGLTPTENPNKSHVTKARAFARLSTASIGKFTDKLPHEKPQDRLGKKRKFLPNYTDTGAEKTRSLDILSSVLNKRPKMDVNKATNRQILEEDRAPKKKAGSKRRSKAGTNLAKAKKGHRSSKLGRRKASTHKRTKRK